MKSLFTTFDVAQLIQADVSTVTKWIDKDILIAFRTPGGHRRVRRTDLLAFLKAHEMPVPPELVADRILVISEEPAVHAALRRGLKQVRDVELSEATSGVDGVLLVAEQRPTAALVDLQLKDLDPYELCRRVAARPALEKVKLITLTGRPGPDALSRSKAAGAIACLGKPVDVAALLVLLRPEDEDSARS